MSGNFFILSFLCCLLFCFLNDAEALLSGERPRVRTFMSTCSVRDSESEIENPYDPSFFGGRVRNLSEHVGYLDSSLKKSSGTGLFDWINERGQGDGSEVTTVELLDENTRFGVLSHGTQSDPVYNYGNKASLELFGYTIDELCQTPSRFSTVPVLMKDRDNLIKAIETRGYGYIDDAVRVKSDGELFIIDRILIWTVFDEADNRIGLAAVYDKENVRAYVEQC